MKNMNQSDQDQESELMKNPKGSYIQYLPSGVEVEVEYVYMWW